MLDWRTRREGGGGKMRKAPQGMALFFVAIVVGRVAAFISLGLKVGWTGWLFGIGIATCVYVAMYYSGIERTKKRARWVAGFFITVDLFFNEGELIRTLSVAALVPPHANFLNLGQSELTVWIQRAALLFGAVPTIAVALLGWLQSDVDIYYTNKLTPWQRVTKAVASMFGNITVAIAIRAEGIATWILPVATKQGKKLPLIDGQIVGKNKAELSAADIAYIVANNRAAIMARFGVSDGTAGNWKKEFKGSQNANNLPSS